MFSVGAAVSGGNLMSDLFNKLAMRRKGESEISIQLLFTISKRYRKYRLHGIITLYYWGFLNTMYFDETEVCKLNFYSNVHNYGPVISVPQSEGQC